MKKFSKMLTLGLALAMTFGMTVSAKNSPDPDFGGFEPDPGFTIDDGTYNHGWRGEHVWGFEYGKETSVYKAGVEAASKEAAKNAVQQTFGEGVTVQGVLAVYDYTIVGTDEHQTVRFEGERTAHNQAYALLHYPNGNFNATPEVVWLYPDVDENGNFCYSARLTGGSPYVLVLVESQEGVPSTDWDGFAYASGDPIFGQAQGSVPTVAAPGTSPKTGETLPVAGMMAVLCLAGALVCIKKASYNA